MSRGTDNLNPRYHPFLHRKFFSRRTPLRKTFISPSCNGNSPTDAKPKLHAGNSPATFPESQTPGSAFTRGKNPSAADPLCTAAENRYSSGSQFLTLLNFDLLYSPSGNLSTHIFSVFSPKRRAASTAPGRHEKFFMGRRSFCRKKRPFFQTFPWPLPPYFRGNSPPGHIFPLDLLPPQWYNIQL